MEKDVATLLEEMQTGEYIPTEEEQNVRKYTSDIIGTNAPTKEETDYKLRHPSLINENSSLGLQAGLAGWGTSEYDRGTYDPDVSLENQRAIEQPGFWKIVNGGQKGGIIMLTTAANSIAGILDGLVEGKIEEARQVFSGEDYDIQKIIGKGTNNAVARTMKQITDLSEKWFPTYYTDEERSPEYQKHWLRHVLTPNFIGDSFLKNLGFTGGAIIGGTAWSRVLDNAVRSYTAGQLMRGVTAAASGDAEATAALENTMKLINDWAAHLVDEDTLIKNIASSAKQLNKMKAFEQMFGGVIGAFGEGMMEGEMAHDESMKNSRDRIDPWYNENLSALRQDFIEEMKTSNPDALNRFTYVGEDGLPHIQYELNEEGERLFNLDQRRVDLAKEYKDQLDFAKDQADRVGAYTFELNIPLLTLDNTLMFGRLFSGGWKTARKNVVKVAGGIEKGAANKIASNYAAMSDVPQRVGEAIRTSLMEGAEEMYQGYISSGAKKVADDRLTSFNDEGYDKQSFRNFGKWLEGMNSGGKEYLSDVTNWQEGFLGLITGGISASAKAFRDSRERKNGTVSTSADVAAELNKIVAQERYKNLFKGFARHDKANREMDVAAINNDQYTWKTENDKQLIGDIMMFARAGRLQDLYDLIDYYAESSDEALEAKGVVDEATSVVNQQEVQNNPGKVIASVKEQAKDIKDTIKLYNSLAALAPEGVSEEQLEELIATAMNIKAFEKRYLSMFDKVLSRLDEGKYIQAISGKDIFGEELQDEEDKRARMREIYNSLTQFYTGTDANDITFKDILDISEIVPKLREMVGSRGDTDLIKMLDDMDKVADDRKNFIRKLTTLRNMDPADFNKQAMNPEKATEETKKEKAEQESKDINGVMDIHDKMAEMTPSEAEEYVNNTLRSVQAENAAADQFVHMYDTYNDYRKHLAETSPSVVKSDGSLSDISDIILKDVFRKSATEEELLKNLETNLMDKESVSARVQQLVDQGELAEEFMNQMVLDNMYNNSVKAIQDSIVPFKKILNDTAGRNNVNNNQKPEKASRSTEPNGMDNPDPASVSKSPEVSQPGQPKAEKPAGQPQETSGSDQEPTTAPTESDSVFDAMSVYSDKTPSTEEATVTDRKGDSRVGYYQQSIPEILLRIREQDTNVFVTLKDLVRRLRVASNASEVADLTDSIRELSRNFVLFDEDGKPVGKNASFGPTYKWLQDTGAFDYIATQLNVNDQVVFCYMKDCPLYNEKPQVVVGVVKERNEQGEITAVQPLTVLSQRNSEAGPKRAKYAYLDELYDAFLSDYDSQSPDGALYIFGGRTNPKTSKVFGLRPGIVPFDSSDKNIVDIQNYSESAPIVIVGENNEPVLLRGTADKSLIFLPTRNNFAKDENPSRYGRLYYMVKNGDNTFIPVAIHSSALTRGVFDNAADGSFVDGIHKSINSLDDLVNRFQDTKIEDLNASLSSMLSALNRKMVLNDVIFTIHKSQSADGSPFNILNIKFGEKENESVDIYPGSDKTAFDVIADLKRPIRISPQQSRLEDSKNNLRHAIEEGLVKSNASMLRQKGVNFLFDPWNPKTGKFERLLSYPTNTSVSEQNAAASTEPVGPAQSNPEADRITVVSTTPQSSSVSATSESSISNNTLDFISGSFDNLTQEMKDSLTSKGVRKEDWETAPEEIRKAFLDC